MTIDYRNLRRIDLNLVVALHALVEEGSVSKAARRLNLGQPAMSHLLRRLRDLFADDILVKTGSSMAPTRRAQALAAKLSEGLNVIDAALQQVGDFDPSTHAQDFRIAMSDSLESSLGSSLWRYMGEHAPACRLRITPFQRAPALDRLDANDLDLAIGVLGHLRSWHRAEILYDESYAGLTATPFVADSPNLDEYCQRPHVLVSQPDDFNGRVDRFLRKAGKSRRVAMSTSRFHAVPFFLLKTDAVAILPTRVADEIAERFDLLRFEPPLEIPPFTVKMAWHQRHDETSSHRWLRQAIQKLVTTRAYGR